MKPLFQLIRSLFFCLLLIPFTGCTTLGDDAFAIYAKRGNTNQALASIQPHSGQLRVKEVNGREYYPIEYSLINGDKRLTYALIENNSPTRLYGKSLAYNAAYAKQQSLARDLAANGYGSSGDIASANGRRAADERRRAANARAASAFALGMLVAIMSSGSGGGGGYQDQSALIGAQSAAMGTSTW